jgi:hypothetical protein
VNALRECPRYRLFLRDGRTPGRDAVLECFA